MIININVSSIIIIKIGEYILEKVFFWYICISVKWGGLVKGYGLISGYTMSICMPERLGKDYGLISGQTMSIWMPKRLSGEF